MTPKYNFLNRATSGLVTPKRKKSGMKVFSQTILILGVAVAVVVIAAGVWFWSMTFPADKNFTGEAKTFLVEPSESIKTIGDRLERDGVIRSAVAFWMYSKVARSGLMIETGRYKLAPSMTMMEIIDVLEKGGEVAPTADITFLPGGDKLEAHEAMREIGFDDTQIGELDGGDYLDEIKAKYPRLFEGWASEKGLEGYFWGDTYEIFLESGPKGALNKALAEMDALMDDDLMGKLLKNEMSFYENLTLASIVAKEDANFDHQKIIAQIFLNRLEIGMNLGSDMTYYYGAKLLGVEPDYNLDSPYNTRLVSGLTPTPIATPSLNALKALAEPTPTDDLYFLSGDDDNLYTARDEAGHQANIANHCHVKCLLP